jgi:hypothetical protein
MGRATGGLPAGFCKPGSCRSRVPRRTFSFDGTRQRNVILYRNGAATSGLLKGRDTGANAAPSGLRLGRKSLARRHR